MKLKKFDEIPMAGHIVEPGNAMEYKTGGWRAMPARVACAGYSVQTTQ